MVVLTEMTNLAIDLIGVRKVYARNIHALRGVNIQVGRGEIFGLLGPNGAGKSTLVKIMMTVVRPTSAMGTLLGRPLGHRGKLARVGYLPEDHRFPPYLTGAQVLDFYAALSKTPVAQRRRNSARLLDRVGMSQWADTRIDRYSKGMMQRIGIAQALMNDPDLVVLDEPTDGLDPVARREVRELLLELRSQGKTIFLNSHLLSELEMVCDRVAILVDGMVARQGAMLDLTRHTTEYRILLGSAPPGLTEALKLLGATVEDRTATIQGEELPRVNAAIDAIRAAGVVIESVQPHRCSLEDLLVEAMGRSTSVVSAAAKKKAGAP